MTKANLKSSWNRDWVNILFFSITPIATLFLTFIFFQYNDWSWKWFVLFAVSFAVTNMSITCGYHRYFAHRAYDAHPLLKFCYLFFGAGAYQGSVVEWGSDHRRHHKYVDTEDDPYSVNEGLWWAHMGWLFRKDLRPDRLDWGKDFFRDPWIRFQHERYFSIALIAGFLLPMAIGWLMGSALGGLVFGAGWRLVFSHQTTFFINSLCHWVGQQPYFDGNTARDSWFISVFTFGEGYHNYHHRFQADYRNGIRWYDWDPSKWFIYLSSLVGFSRGLKRTPQWEIVNARLLMDEKRLLLSNGISRERIALLKQKVQEAHAAFRKRYDEYIQARQGVVTLSQERLAKLKKELSVAKNEFKAAWSLWRATSRTFAV